MRPLGQIHPRTPLHRRRVQTDGEPPGLAPEGFPSGDAGRWAPPAAVAGDLALITGWLLGMDGAYWYCTVRTGKISAAHIFLHLLNRYELSTALSLMRCVIV
jgi:hypothetical protein